MFVYMYVMYFSLSPANVVFALVFLNL